MATSQNGQATDGAQAKTTYEGLWRAKLLTPHQLQVYDIRQELWRTRPTAAPSLEVVERFATKLVPQSAALTPSSRVVRAAEVSENPIEYRRFIQLEEQWGWLASLRLPQIQKNALDSEESAVCRWIHVSSKFPEYLQGFLWALSEHNNLKETSAALRLIDNCIQRQERYSKHGRHFAPFCQVLNQGSNDSGVTSPYPMLISLPFLDWSVGGKRPPLRFQVDKREGTHLSRSSSHPLRSILQYFYRLEDTHDREKDQVWSKHRPWSSDRTLDLRVRRWYGRYPTSVDVDELWILALDANHIVTFSSNQSWKSRYPPLQLPSRIEDISFRSARNAMAVSNKDPYAYTALVHAITSASGATGLLHRSFWPDVVLCLTDRYAGYLGHLQFRLHRSPNTRLVMDLLQVQEELNIIVRLMQDQLNVLDGAFVKLGFRTNDQSMGASDGRTPPQATNEHHAAHHLAELRDSLQRELTDLEEIRENTNTLVNRTVQLVNIRLEDHGKAILVFTIVTIIFLPLSFVSSFFGMNVMDIRNMSGSQSIFWIVAACVTVGVVALSSFLAFSGGSIMEQFLLWKEARERQRAQNTVQEWDRSGTAGQGFRVLGMESEVGSWQ